MPLPKFTKTSNTYSPFTFEKGRYVPVNEPLTPNQTIGKAGGGAVKVVDHGAAEQFREIIMNNVSATNRNNLLNFLKDTTVNYMQNTFTFINEEGTSYTVRLWKAEGLDFPRVRGGLYNIRLLLRDKLPLDSVSMPSFSVYQANAGQIDIVNQTNTLMEWGTEEWDTHDYFDLANGKFTPLVAGKYLFTGHVWLKAGGLVASDFLVLLLYKNGSLYHEAAMRFSGTGNFEGPSLVALADANGTTDYFEMFIHQVTGGNYDTVTSGEVSPISIYSYFQGIGVSANNLSRPSFSVSQSAGQAAIVTTTDTKMEWDTEAWDDTSDFASDRFTPTTAGKYFFTANVWLAATSGGIARGELLALQLYKNGSLYKQTEIKYAGTGNFEGPMLGVLADANGSSDYFEMWVHHQVGINKNIATFASDALDPISNYVYFQGHLISDSRFPMPAFSVYQGSPQTDIVTAAYTKVEFDTEEFDTHGTFAANRFTPAVEGKYLLSGHLWLGAANFADDELIAIQIYKNGVNYKQGEIKSCTAANFQGPMIAAVVDVSDIADYFEMYVYHTMGANMATGNLAPLSVYTYFQGVGIP